MPELRALWPLGIEALGYDLEAASPEVISELVEAMMDTGLGVLVVRSQRLEAPALQRVLLKFTAHFGQPLQFTRRPGQLGGAVPSCLSLSALGNYCIKAPRQFGTSCEVGDIIGELEPAGDSRGEWQTDGSFLMRPPVAIALYAPDVDGGLPADGGETRFASGTLAWEALPTAERKLVAGLASVHSWEVLARFLEERSSEQGKTTAEDRDQNPDVVWPLVRTHPRTGRHSLYVNPKSTRRVISLSSGSLPEDMDDETGIAFVHKIGQKVADSGVYSHFWQRGDLVIWDNRVLLHAASPFNPYLYEQLLFRAEFPGEPAVFRPDVDLLQSLFDSKETFPAPYFPWDFHLPCNPDSVCWGYLDAAAPPRLTVRSGETVRVDNVNGGPELLPPASARDGKAHPCWRLLREYREIHEKVKDRLGPHILTGPICVEGAEPGDVLQVDILEVRLRSNWAWTISRPYGGALGLAAKSHLRHTLLEPPLHVPPAKRARLFKSGLGNAEAAGAGAGPGESEGFARPSWGGRLPLRPFFGVLGVAPPPDLGRQHSIPPRDEFGGNLDLKELAAGSTLYLPVHAPGALLFVGDGHALQGDGECCGTALETALSGVLRLTLHRAWRSGAEPSGARRGASGRAGAPSGPLRQPRAETPTELITMACQPSFEEAAKLAISDMLDWLAQRVPTLERGDAYCLLSVAADVRVTQLVNAPQRGAHVVLRKHHLEELAQNPA